MSITWAEAFALKIQVQLIWALNIKSFQISNGIEFHLKIAIQFCWQVEFSLETFVGFLNHFTDIFKNNF